MIEDHNDRFEQRLREAAQDYHRPPATPQEELWRGIVAARAARRRHRAFVARAWLPLGVGIAAVLAVGIGIGRWTAGGLGPGVAGPAATGGAAAATAAASGTLVYRVAAAQYLTRTEALLTGFRAEARAGRPDVQFARQAHDLLAMTRLMLDSPAAQDHHLKGLLEDLEVVLAQIAQLTPGEEKEDVELITQGLEQRSVLLRLRTANPAGPGPMRTEGAL